MPIMPTLPTELEIAYMIRAAEPAAIGRAMAALESLDGHTIRHSGDLQIRDILFDTPARSLGARGFVLRVRRIAGSDLLTLKGASRATTYGAIERLEIEGPWSAEIVAKITGALGENGLTLPDTIDATAADHIKAMRAAGLEIIQDRETARAIFAIAGEPERTIAELSLDVVTLRFDERVVRFTQVEIESKSTTGAAALPALTAALQKRYVDTLRLWPYGKLATGQVLAQWFNEGKLDRYCGTDGDLAPDGIDALEGVLKARFTRR